MQHIKIDPQNLPQPMSPSPSQGGSGSLPPKHWLSSRVALLLSAFRKDDYRNPELFAIQLAAALEAFPVEVVEFVTNPKTGLQRTLKFPPSIAEVVEACNAELSYQQKVQHYSTMRTEQKKLPEPTYLGTSGDGGPGTVYSDYETAVAKHGRPIGRFEAE